MWFFGLIVFPMQPMIYFWQLNFVAVVFVVSSTSLDPVEDFSQLYVKQKESAKSKYPKWLLPHLYYYHVLLHDAGGSTVEYKKWVEVDEGMEGRGVVYRWGLGLQQGWD